MSENVATQLNWDKIGGSTKNRHKYKKEKDQFFINKKNEKKKHNKKDLAISNMEILESGKVKVSGGNKFDIGRIVKSNLEDIVISRLDAIISKEGVKKKEPCKAFPALVEELRIAELHAQFTGDFTRTIIVPIKKDHAENAFHYLNGSILGTILRTSTLAYSYKKVKKDWLELNKDDNTGFTNVMYIPDILVFLNEKNGRMIKHPFKINVLILAYPSPKKMLVKGDASDAGEVALNNTSHAQRVERIIGDMMDAAIKVGAKNLIVNPYGYKYLRENAAMTLDLWMELLSSKRFQEQVDSIDFSLPDENLYIRFAAKLRTSEFSSMFSEAIAKGK